MKYTFKTGSDLADFILDLGLAPTINDIAGVCVFLECPESWIESASRLDDLEYLKGQDEEGIYFGK